MERDWINTRMRKLLHNDLEYSKTNIRFESKFCPECKKHVTVHDNEKCFMRFEEDTCVTSVQMSQQPELWLP